MMSKSLFLLFIINTFSFPTFFCFLASHFINSLKIFEIRSRELHNLFLTALLYSCFINKEIKRDCVKNSYYNRHMNARILGNAQNIK